MAEVSVFAYIDLRLSPHNLFKAFVFTFFTMTVFANNVAQTLKKNSTLFNFLDYNNIKEFEGVAIAVNNEIVPKNSWNSYLLHENDKITIITATQGG